MQPDSTPSDGYGLSPQQEQAAALITAGLSVQEVAERLGIHRSTLWHWRNLETFQAYLNALRADAQHHRAAALTNLQHKAVQTVERLLVTGSDGVALRAAALVLQLAPPTSGETDPRRLIRVRANADTGQFMLDALISGADQASYERRCGELGIEP